MLAALLAGLLISSAPPAAPAAAAPAPAVSVDGVSQQSIIHALYEVISGKAGEPRNWDRFRALFYPGGRMIAVHRDSSGRGQARIMTPDDYIRLSQPLLDRMGFFEAETASTTEKYGELVFVQSAYQSRHAPGDATPFDSGTNSIHLFFDGTRWWIMTVAWS